MEIYSAYRRPNLQRSNTLKNEVKIEWKSQRKNSIKENRVKREKVYKDNSDSDAQWLYQMQKRWALLREKAMEYFFPESVS